MSEFVPLLSGQPFSSYSPEGFRTYIKSLYFKRAPKKSAKKKERPGFSVRLSKKGTLTVTTRRRPKYVTPAELVALEGKYPANVVFLTLRRLDFRLMSHEEADLFNKELLELVRVMSGEGL